MQRLIAYFIAAVLLAAGLVLTVANSQHALEVLAGAGSAKAAYRLGEYHSNSQNEETYDLDRALRWFEQAAGSGDLEALYHVGQLHFTGSVKNHSYEAAYLSFLKGAEAGHVPSMHSLAMMYGLGLGVEQDLLAAERWYQKVVNLGNAATQLNLALLYFNHPEAFGAEKAALAARELQKQADLGDATAALTLGQALIEGNGVDQDVEKGIALLFEAAETEPDAAYLFLGSTYLRGLVARRTMPRQWNFLKNPLHWEMT
ncbi:hypothetical protein CHH27_11020 [Labrenzia sp. VG12]|nr:hypothetical protein CHH27_11020 [Labrenzia sp. VG12]